MSHPVKTPEEEHLRVIDTRTPEPVAVIDVGTTSIRMTVAQIDGEGNVTVLENLSQAVSTGEDTFRRGALKKSTIEDAVKVFQSFGQTLKEYEIQPATHVRAIATSAIREASNGSVFLDRVFVSTGIEVELVDEAEVNRLTYLAVQPFLDTNAKLASSRVVIAEVGGGVTELLRYDHGNVDTTLTVRMGSLRLRETIELNEGAKGQAGSLLDTQISRSMSRVKAEFQQVQTDYLLALGGDIRFVAQTLDESWERDTLGTITLDDVRKLRKQVLPASPDDLVRRYQLTFSEAETMGPALLAYERLAETLGVDRLLVSGVTLRDGLLKELAAGDSWAEKSRDQIVRSARDLGEKYGYDEEHAMSVAESARHLFRILQDVHGLGTRYQFILYLAGLLHEIGMYVSNNSHHKHSMYLILNSPIFGLGKKDRNLVALVARYHRRAVPKATHLGYAELDHSERILVAKLAAILRVADALSRAQRKPLGRLEGTIEEGCLTLTVEGVADLSLAKIALKDKGKMFEDVYGLSIMLQKGSQ